MLENNGRIVVGASFVRYMVDKSGAHVEFYDSLSRQIRRFKLARLANLQIVNLQRIKES